MLECAEELRSILRSSGDKHFKNNSRKLHAPL